MLNLFLQNCVKVSESHISHQNSTSTSSSTVYGVKSYPRKCRDFGIVSEHAFLLWSISLVRIVVEIFCTGVSDRIFWTTLYKDMSQVCGAV